VGFNPNKQTQVLPVLASQVKAELEGKPEETKKEKSGDEGITAEHHSLLARIIAEELKVEVSQIKEFELCLYDTQPATVGGALNEFIFARGLDNLMMSFVSLRALIDSTDDSKAMANEEQIRMVALFDNEEIGSASVMGAASALLPTVLARINGDSSTYDSAIRKSFLISADMAHALHPNFSDKHEPCHKPMMHKGLVIKENANQRYATSSVTSFLLSEVAKRHQLPVQKFCVRNDMGCGSTIGPILASQVGIRTVDVGIPQWAMHSIRETCGTADTLSTYELFKHFYNEFHSLDKQLQTDV
jgi:aspartyl aminopeptidase